MRVIPLSCLPRLSCHFPSTDATDAVVEEDVEGAHVSRREDIHWSTSNRKLMKLQTIGFGIPAGVSEETGFNTCPAKGACASYCYARQGFYVHERVRATRERNLRIVRRDLDRFVKMAVLDLSSFEKGLKDRRALWAYHRIGVPRPRWAKVGRPMGRAPLEEPPKALVVRVHDSGDFFSADYLRAWYTIAKTLPKVTFYAYTKQFFRLQPLIWWGRPSNFRIIQSIGGRDDDKINKRLPHARVFINHEDRERMGYVDGTETDLPAILGERQIGLCYHGSRPLRENERKALLVLP